MTLRLFLIMTGIIAIPFIFLPGLDTGFSQLFYRQGDGFFLRDWGPFVFFYESVEWLEVGVIGLIIALIVLRLIPAARRFHVRWQVTAYIALSLIIGPWLVTNELLKNHLGRARPAQTVEFGGTKNFSPAFILSDQCKRNCAFVSGHAAFAFFFVTFAFLVAPGAGRRAGFAFALLFGLAVGLTRIAQGAHYLSDVIFAALINIAIAWALYEWLIARNGRINKTQI